jgi:hypothetical protein
VGLVQQATQGFIENPEDIIRHIDVEDPLHVAEQFPRSFDLAEWLPDFLRRTAAPRTDLLQDSLTAGTMFYTPSDLLDPCYRARLFVRACTGSTHVPSQRIKVCVLSMPSVPSV